MPWRTVLGNVVLGPEIQGKERTAAGTTARGFLRLVGLGRFPRHYPHELSGGMRQRVNLARALTVGADVLLMDEPFAALDSQTREIMQAELLRIWRDTGKTVLLVTHQIDEAVYLSDRVLIFTTRPGRLKDEVRIDLPRPRDLAVKRTPDFARYTDRIWRAIEEEVRRSIELELEAG
jgi:NitT/TauT family transport system ATP-binding protein